MPRRNAPEPARAFSLFSENCANVTREGVEALARWMPEMRSPFDEPGIADATWPAHNHPLSVFEHFSSRPTAAVGIAGALAKDIVEYERTGLILGRKPFAWQVAAIKWLVFSLLNDGTSYLIEGGPGTGKTLVLGEIVRAAIASGMFDHRKKILLVFNKPHIAAQQLFDQAARTRRFDPVARLHSDEEMHDCLEIADGEGRTQLLPLSPRSDVGDSLSMLSGDMLRGIPSDMRKDGRVVTAMHNFAIEGRDDIPVLDERTAENAVVVACSQMTLHTSTHVRRILEQTGLIIVDDARKSANVFQELCTTNGNPHVPLVAMASALSETNGERSRPMADAYSPKLTMFAAMEPDAEGRKISPDIGIDLSPRTLDTPLYPSASPETVARIVSTHFEELETERMLELAPSHAQDTFVVVPHDSVQPVTDALRKAYAERALPATVVPFFVQDVAAKKQQYRRQALMGWAVTPYSTEDRERFGPKVLVMPPSEFADALSIPFPNVIVTGDVLSSATMGRRIGRLGHVSGEGHPAHFRATMRVVLTAETRHTPFEFLVDDPQAISYVPLGILRGSTGANSDRTALRGATRYSIPSTNDLRNWPRSVGAAPSDGEPCMNDGGAMLAAAVDSLRTIARELDVKTWMRNANTRSNLLNRAIEELWPFAKALLRLKGKDEWMATVVRATAKAWDNPLDVIDAIEAAMLHPKQLHTRERCANNDQETDAPSTMPSADACNDALDEPVDEELLDAKALEFFKHYE